MSLTALITSFPWNRYSKKLLAKIEKPRCVGVFNLAESEARDMRLAKATVGSMTEGNCLSIYWLVDKDDGIIVDAKFQVFGQSALIGAAEIASELVIGKNYDQAMRIGTTLIDQQVRDRPDTAAFPRETTPHLNLVIEAIEQAAAQCSDLPLASSYVAPPVPTEMGEILEGGYPGWLELPLPKKLAVIEEVLNQDLRPYIALDAGGVEVVSLVNDQELIIAYQGSCTSCYSSVGTTLSYIQQVLRAKVHPGLKVVPDMSNFQHKH
jgi:NifU-like protein